MLKCPLDGTELTKLEKKWHYSRFTVLSYRCEKCQRSIRGYYYHERLAFTIPKNMQSLIRKNVLAYLKGHKGLGSTEQIAEALRISVPEVKNTLKELERGGIVENIHGKK